MEPEGALPCSQKPVTDSYSKSHETTRPHFYLRSILILSCLDNLVIIVTRLRDGRPGFDSKQEGGIFLFDTASRPALGPIHPLRQWEPVLFPRGWSGRGV